MILFLICLSGCASRAEKIAHLMDEKRPDTSGQLLVFQTDEEFYTADPEEVARVEGLPVEVVREAQKLVKELNEVP